MPAPRRSEQDKIKELEAELSQMTNRILVLQNENNELRSVEVAANHSVDYRASEEFEEPASNNEPPLE